MSDANFLLLDLPLESCHPQDCEKLFDLADNVEWVQVCHLPLLVQDSDFDVQILYVILDFDELPIVSKFLFYKCIFIVQCFQSVVDLFHLLSFGFRMRPYHGCVHTSDPRGWQSKNFIFSLEEGKDHFSLGEELCLVLSVCVIVLVFNDGCELEIEKEAEKGSEPVDSRAE